MSTWAGHIADLETARKSAGSAFASQDIILLVDGDLASKTSARAAVATKGALLHIADQIWIRPCQRGYTVASNLGATFSSSFATFYASLPDNGDRPRNMIHS